MKSSVTGAVLYEGPFWVAIFERQSMAGYAVARLLSKRKVQRECSVKQDSCSARAVICRKRMNPFEWSWKKTKKSKSKKAGRKEMKKTISSLN